MRMSASRIRSINRAIAKVQPTPWTASRKNPYKPTDVSTLSAAKMASTIKIVAVPKEAAS